MTRYSADIDKLRPISDEERYLLTLFKRALPFAWKEYAREVPGGDPVPARKMRLESPFAATRFFEEVIGRDERGYDIAARIIAQHMDAVERPVRSNLMTRMARAIPDCIMRTRDANEREVAQFGQIICRLIGDFPERFVEWAEDMEADDHWNDLKRQPTDIIRGVFLSAAIDASRTPAFWALAATSETFPLRLFSDPCGPGSMRTFTPFHLRRYADMFAAMPDAALRKFGRHMRRNAKVRLIERVIIDRSYDPPVEERIVVEETMTYRERITMLREIVAAVRDVDRRCFVSRVLLKAA